MEQTEIFWTEVMGGYSGWNEWRSNQTKHRPFIRGKWCDWTNDNTHGFAFEQFPIKIFLLLLLFINFVMPLKMKNFFIPILITIEHHHWSKLIFFVVHLWLSNIVRQRQKINFLASKIHYSIKTRNTNHFRLHFQALAKINDNCK